MGFVFGGLGGFCFFCICGFVVLVFVFIFMDVWLVDWVVLVEVFDVVLFVDDFYFNVFYEIMMKIKLFDGLIEFSYEYYVLNDENELYVVYLVF